jgi:hypothetical protein
MAPISPADARSVMRAGMARAWTSPAGALLAGRGWRLIDGKLVRPNLLRRLLNRFL